MMSKNEAFSLLFSSKGDIDASREVDEDDV